MACKDCETIYRKIERPDSYRFDSDINPVTLYYFPINSFAPAESYYTDKAEMQSDYESFSGPGFTINPGGFGSAMYYLSRVKSYFLTLEEAIAYHSSFDFSGCLDCHWISYNIKNPNYGKPYESNSSFLSWPLVQKVSSYSELKDPFWKLTFPVCGTSGNKINDSSFKLKECGKWKIEWRLRLRPLVFFGWPNDGNINPFDFYTPLYGPDEETDENRTNMWNAYKLHRSLETQEGSKMFGLTPLRLETGIYNEVSKTETPIVWSEGKYPQPVVTTKNYWSKDFENGNYISMFNSTPQLWSGLNPHLMSDDIEKTEAEYPNEVYNYSFGAIIDSGLFSAETNLISAPGKIQLSTSRQLKGDIYESSLIPHEYLIEDVKKFFLEYDDSSSPYGNLEIVQKAYSNGNWVKIKTINYSITGINTSNDSYVELTVTGSSSIVHDAPKVENALNFYNGTIYKTRYEIIPILNKKTYNVPKMDWDNIQVGNVTELTQDFVYELNGFTHVNLERENEISIYLKALPDNNGTKNLEFDPAGELPNFYNLVPMQNGGIDPILISSSRLVPNANWPWGTLSADERTGYNEQFKKYYEPILPVKAELLDFEGNYFSSVDAGRYFRWGFVLSDGNWGGPIINDWYIMIEEGWVRATPTCENCCD